jgi:crossover junction endodeoxyribonuclease RuvC
LGSNLRILGIDPGYDIVGWSILDDGFKVENYGVIKTSPGDNFDERLLQIHRSLNNIIEEFSPQCAAVEKVFFQNNTKTAISVAKAIGVIILTLKLKGISYTEYSPTEIKHSVTGYGKADKEQIYFMMKKLLKLESIEGPDDAADALAIAMCHQLNGKGLSLK